MKSKKRILIAGGDMRQIFCASKLAEEYDISLAGFDSGIIPAGTGSFQHDDAEKFEYIVLPVPPLDENENISTPCFSGELSPKDIAGKLVKGGTVFTGRNDSRLAEIFPYAHIENYMEREELCLKNAVPTAEGAVQTALEELPVTLNGLPVLIVGMGRIGTALTEILKGFGADITAAVRSSTGAAKARIHGIKSIPAEDIGGRYALVFNTAPELVFNSDRLKMFNDSTLFIDLASRPGGIDFASASALGKKVIWALGLPGKTAPMTAGEIVAETIAGMIREGGNGYE